MDKSFVDGITCYRYLVQHKVSDNDDKKVLSLCYFAGDVDSVAHYEKNLASDPLVLRVSREYLSDVDFKRVMVVDTIYSAIDDDNSEVVE